MDGHTRIEPIKFDDQCTADCIICLKNSKGSQQFFHSHSFILKSKSTYFAERLSGPSPQCLEIQCSEIDYDHHLRLVKCLYLPEGSLLNSWDSVRSTLGILQVAAALRCESIVKSCIQYLEAVPWEDSEEDEIVNVVSRLGAMAMPILARIQPVDLVATKRVLISAIRFATSIDGPRPPFGDEVRTSAQEQVEYMLTDDEDVPLITADHEVKMETRAGLSKAFSSFERVLLEFETEGRILQCVSNLEWLCSIVLKMGLMNDFVSKWIDISDKVLHIVEVESSMWGLKVKLIQVTSKVLDAVGYGNVILPAPQRVQLLKSWLPFIRKVKPILDSMITKDEEFPHKMDEDLWQSVEGAVVSLVSALPSNDQAEILAEWMNGEEQRYPDLSEAFECSIRIAAARIVTCLAYLGVCWAKRAFIH
ncbi:hypothetical protein ACS0TY_001531 [Phlomoides rotata]